MTTTSTQQYKTLLKVISCLYFVLGGLVFFRSQEFFYLINIGPKVFHLYEPITLPVDQTWLTITSVTFFTQSLFTFSVLKPTKKAGINSSHLILSKLLSTGLLMFSFFKTQQQFAMLFFGLVEALFLILIVLFAIRSSAHEKIDARRRFKDSIHNS